MAERPTGTDLTSLGRGHPEAAAPAQNACAQRPACEAAPPEMWRTSPQRTGLYTRSLLTSLPRYSHLLANTAPRPASAFTGQECRGGRLTWAVPDNTAHCCEVSYKAWRGQRTKPYPRRDDRPGAGPPGNLTATIL